MKLATKRPRQAGRVRAAERAAKKVGKGGIRFATRVSLACGQARPRAAEEAERKAKEALRGLRPPMAVARKKS